MLKKKNITGILTILSVVSLLLILFIIRGQADMVKAFYVKLAITNIALVFASAGVYLTDLFCETINRKIKLVIWSAASALVLITFLVSFDILSFSKSWNWVVVFGILYILLVQLQLLQWGNRVPQLVRYSALLIVLCDIFLVFFFIAKWQNYKFEAWINFAMVLSIVLTFVGLVSLGKKTTES